MRKPNETDLVRACLDYLKLRGVFAWRQNSGGMPATYKGKKRFVKFHSARGCSDILGILPPNGRLLAVECKMPGNKTTELQNAFLKTVEALGGVSIVARSIDDLMPLFNKENSL